VNSKVYANIHLLSLALFQQEDSQSRLLTDISRDIRHSNSNMSNRFKIVLLGEGRVGKTSILLRYIRGEYSDNQISTLQASYLDKKISVSGANVQLSVWDTAGQERFHALGPIYYRDASKYCV
jgi:GTPase SAR1 family protein